MENRNPTAPNMCPELRTVGTKQLPLQNAAVQKAWEPQWPVTLSPKPHNLKPRNPQITCRALFTEPCLPACLPAWLPGCLSVCLFVCPSVLLSVLPFVLQSVLLSVCLSVLLSARLAIGLYRCLRMPGHCRPPPNVMLHSRSRGYLRCLQSHRCGSACKRLGLHPINAAKFLG